MARKPKRVAAIPDLHLPFTDWKRVEKVYDFLEDEQPDIIIQLGDLYDRFAYSRFARTQDLMTPEEEIAEGRAGAVNFWANIHKRCRKAEKFQLKGNHDDRILSRVLEKFPEVYSIVRDADAELSKFANVRTIQEARDGVFIDGNLYTHGHLTQLGSHMIQLGVNVVHGHTHRGGTVFRNHFGRILWELDCGYLADETSVPLKYSPTAHLSHVKGIGWIDGFGPRFVGLK